MSIILIVAYTLAGLLIAGLFIGIAIVFGILLALKGLERLFTR